MEDIFGSGLGRRDSNYESSYQANDFTPFGDEILLKVLLNLDEQDLYQTSLVCHRWNSITQDRLIWIKRIYFYRRKNLEMIVTSISHLKSITTKPNDKDRVEFLAQTLGELVEYFQSCPADKSWPVVKLDCICRLYGILYKRLLDVSAVLSAVKCSQAKITENFDLLELALRRYLHQLQKMFAPEQANQEPSSIIDIPEARAVWESNVGQRYFVDFDYFFKNVLTVIFPLIKQNKDFEVYLSYFINFPDDGMMTTYKWNQITKAFGFKNFESNFCTYALGRGFCGLINAVKAKEILTKENAATYLIRFSRPRPEVLTVSCKNKRGEIRHVRNTESSSGEPVEIGKFLETRFEGYVPTELGLDETVIAANSRSLPAMCMMETYPLRLYGY